MPAVALTFDDGPGAVTGALLDVLRRHRARATFNVLGDRIAGRESLLRRAVSDGHEIGVHGWIHRDHRDGVADAAAGAARTAELVLAVCDVRPRLFRPPFGLTNRRLELAVARHGVTTVLWDVDPHDFEEPGADAIVDRILATVRPGSIVLLHDDRPALSPTAEAVDVLIPALRRRGLQVVTASEVIGRKPPPARA